MPWLDQVFLGIKKTVNICKNNFFRRKKRNYVEWRMSISLPSKQVPILCSKQQQNYIWCLCFNENSNLTKEQIIHSHHKVQRQTYYCHPDLEDQKERLWQYWSILAALSYAGSTQRWPGSLENTAGERNEDKLLILHLFSIQLHTFPFHTDDTWRLLADNCEV